MRRGWKIALAVLAGIAVLLVLNAITVSNETKDAERDVEGAELIETSSGTLQVLEEGDPQGDPVVLIHGYASSMRWFDQLAPLLTRGHRVIRVDLLGHGGSDKPAAGYAITDQASAIAEALASLGVTDATVVGHSLGGTVATAVAEQSPELATKVVVVNQAPDDSYEHDLGFTAELGRKRVIGQAIYRVVHVAPDSMVRGEFEQAFAPGFSMASGFENPDQTAEDLKAMTFTSFVETADAEGDYTDERPLDERLASIGAPLLVVFGAEDQIYDAEASVEPFRDVPGAQVELLAGVGHSPNVEEPEQLATLIDAFIARVDAARAKQAAREAKERAAAKRAAARKAAKQAAAAERTP